MEHANAWLDSFKTLLVRYETSLGNSVSLAIAIVCPQVL